MSAIHNIDGSYLDRYTHGLRLAGLPEDGRPPTPAPTASPPLFVE
jgi:hypothetical protein